VKYEDNYYQYCQRVITRVRESSQSSVNESMSESVNQSIGEMS